MFELDPVSWGGKAKFNLAVMGRMDLERGDNRDTRSRGPSCNSNWSEVGGT